MRLPVLVCLVTSSVITFSAAIAAPRGLAPGLNLDNRSLTVGVSKGLPGIGDDVQNVTRMVTHESYGFENTVLREAEGTVAGISKELTRLSEEAGPAGTFLFYFTGHGNRGVILAQDRTMKISEIRSALEKGRANAGSPMHRLVMIFDSCYAGSLLDPVRDLLKLGPLADLQESEAAAESVVRELAPNGRAEYWNSLFVFAACRANETSLAGSNGSVFTNAMVTAFNESMSANATLATFVKKTQDYTKGHHPVARFSPTELEDERMR